MTGLTVNEVTRIEVSDSEKAMQCARATRSS